MPKHTLFHCLRLASLLFLWVSGAFFAIGQRKTNAEADRLYLVYADRWQQDNAVVFGAQRLNGKVHFRQGAMQLRCDSAVYFKESNTFRAFGHVRMTQADTVTLTSDSLFYDGNVQVANAYHKVVLTHHKRVLTTDYLNYNRMLNIASYYLGGKLKDGATILTSQVGNYNLGSKEAEFSEDVFMIGKQYDSLKTSHLFYNTESKWAHALGQSNIFSGVNKLYTEDGYYNTETQEARLVWRPEHKHRPTITYQGKTMQGDSLLHEKAKGLSRAWGKVVIKDPKGKRHLFGRYGEYKDSTNLLPPHSQRPLHSQAFVAGDSALVKDFSNEADPLFLHADTLRLHSYYLKTDSTFRVLHAAPKVRAYRSDLQAVADSLTYNTHLQRLSMYGNPIVWNGNRQILGEEINIYMNDSTIDSVYVDRQCLLAEQVDSMHYNQVAGEEMRSYFSRGEMRENHVNRNVLVINFPLEKDSLILYQNYTESTKLRMYIENRRMIRLWLPAAEGVFYAVGTAPPQHNRLPNFAWFDYIRPLSAQDVFSYRGKKAGTALKPSSRREAPVQHLGTTLQKQAAVATSQPAMAFPVPPLTSPSSPLPSRPKAKKRSSLSSSKKR